MTRTRARANLEVVGRRLVLALPYLTESSGFFTVYFFFLEQQALPRTSLLCIRAFLCDIGKGHPGHAVDKLAPTKKAPMMDFIFENSRQLVPPVVCSYYGLGSATCTWQTSSLPSSLEAT